MNAKGISIDAQMLYDFAERGEMVDPDKFEVFGREFFTKIKIRNIFKRLAGYTDENGEVKVMPACELSQDMLAWAAFLHCFFEQKPLSKDRLKERYGLENAIAITLNYVPIMQKYADMGEKDMEVIDLEDIMKQTIPAIRRYKGLD